MSVLVELPKTVQDALNLVAIRSGLDMGRTALRAELNKKTKDLAKTRKELKQKIQQKYAEYLANGTDVRGELTELYKKLNEVEVEFDKVSEPFKERINPLNRIISKLDRKVIPPKVEKALGIKIVPRFSIDEDILLLLQTVK